MKLDRYSLAGFATALAVILLGVSFGNSAALSARVDLCTLQEGSAAIVQGRVEQVTSEWADPDRQLIESSMALRVSSAIAGDVQPGAQLTVRVRGGQMADLAMAVSDEPAFAPGEEVLVFLISRAAGGFAVMDGAQGKFTIAGGIAINQAWQTAYRVADLARALSQAPARTGEGSCRPSIEALPGSVTAAGGAAAPAAYVYSGLKWFGPNPMEEPYVVNVNTADANGGNGSAAAFRDAIVGAGNTWTAAQPTGFAFHYGGTTTVAATQNDGVNALYWTNLGASNVLAEATWWYNTGTGRITEADIRFNDYHAWDATGSPAGSEVDVQSVALHEMGHWLSLGHDTDPSCSSCSVNGPVMCSCYMLGSLKRGLHASDVAGINAIYPGQAGPTATPPPAWWNRRYLPLTLK